MGFLRTLFGSEPSEEQERDQMFERLGNAAFPGGDGQIQRYADAVFTTIGGKLSKEQCFSLTQHARVVFTMKQGRGDVRAVEKMRASVSVQQPSLTPEEINRVLVALEIR